MRLMRFGVIISPQSAHHARSLTYGMTTDGVIGIWMHDSRIRKQYRHSYLLLECSVIQVFMSRTFLVEVEQFLGYACNQRNTYPSPTPQE